MGRSTFSGPVRSDAGMEIGSSGTQLTQITKGTVAIDPLQLAANTVRDVDVALTGATTSDVVIAHPPADLETNLQLVGAWISAADTLTVRLANDSGSPIEPVSKNWNFVLIKS